MNVIDVAKKLNVDVSVLSNYKYVITIGDAETPQRFWRYEAYTNDELSDELFEELKYSKNIQKIIH